mmetsp:Transcript_3337/g.4138  ORF Transcript_3337/g.4138 Transcript_3337/m.4138 type:complete len:313 (+) Transcript_3337:35-973(+)
MARTPGMIFLKEQNMIVEEAIGTRLFDEPPKREPCDVCVSDFDGVNFKVNVAPEKTNFVTVHINVGLMGEKLKKELYAPEILEKVYGPMVVTPDKGYDFAVGVDLDTVKPEEKDGVLKKISCLRRHVLSAPIVKALDGVKAGTGAKLPFMMMEMRNNECMFVKPGNDRCTVVYAFNFPDVTDNALARVMMQQFAKESAKVNGAPPCSYSEAKNPPLEIRDQKIDAYTNGCGFLSFVIFASHISEPAKYEKAITMLSTFRNYLHYHIKASKTYLHMRMRKKVAGWLQVLNRSHHEKDAKEAKTASGKTFKRSS